MQVSCIGLTNLALNAAWRLRHLILYLILSHNLTNIEIRDYIQNIYEIYIQPKYNKEINKSSTSTTEFGIGERIYSDISGLISPKTYNSYRYYLTFLDKASRYLTNRIPNIGLVNNIFMNVRYGAASHVFDLTHVLVGMHRVPNTTWIWHPYSHTLLPHVYTIVLERHKVSTCGINPPSALLSIIPCSCLLSWRVSHAQPLLVCLIADW